MGRLVPASKRFVTTDAPPSPRFTTRDPEETVSFVGSQVAGVVEGFRNLGAGFMQSGAGVNEMGANTFMLLDRGAKFIEDRTGMERGEAFSKLERQFRAQAEYGHRVAQELGGGDDLSDKAAQLIGGLPVELAKYATAARLAGPVVGFAAAGALEESDRGFLAAAEGAAKGATIGALFKVTEPLAPVARGVTVGGTVAAAETAEGGFDEDVALNAVALGTLAGLSSKGRARGRDVLRNALPQPKGGDIPALIQRMRLRRAAERGERELPETVEEKPSESLIKVEARESPLIITDKATEAQRFLGEDFSDLEVPNKVVNLNLNRIEGPESLKALQAELTKFYRGEINEARRGEIALEQTERLAGELGMSVKDLLARRKGQAFNAEEITAARKINQSVLEEVNRLSEKVRTGQATDADKANLLRMTALYEATVQQTLGATAEAGRALGALRIQAKGERQRQQEIRRLIRDYQGATGKELEVFADMLAQAQSPQHLSRILREANRPTTFDKLLEVWINGLLSNPVTHTVNFVSNLSVAALNPPETYLAATIGAMRGTPNRVRFREGNAAVWGLVHGTNDGLRLAKHTLLTGESIGHQKIEVRVHEAIPGKKGQVIRLPGRFLLAGDALFREIGRQQEIHQRSMAQALREGRRGRAAGVRALEIARNPSEAVLEAAAQRAEYQTFTRAVGGFGQGVQTALKAVPAGRLIIPFVRTPINIGKFTIERTPLAPTLSEVREARARGGRDRDTADARMAFGTGLSVWAVSQYAAGNLTGGGPSNPALRDLWLVDHQPYSMRVGDEWVSYSRIEPFASILGLAADFAEISGHIGEDESEGIASAIVKAFARNISNKTFLGGLADAAAAIGDPDRFGDAFVRRMAGSIVPAGVAQAARLQDPTLRDARTAIDRIKSRLPAYSQTVPPRTNVWGEPIFLDGGWGPDIVSPFYQMSADPDPASAEAGRVKARLSRQDRELNGVPLDGWEYFRLRQLAGGLAKRQIESLVSAPHYEILSDGMKRRIMEDIWRDSNKTARLQLLGELASKDPKRFLLDPALAEVEELAP